MQVSIIPNKNIIVKIEITQEEFDLIYNGLGKTSEYSRETAGMNAEQSKTFGLLYDAFDKAKSY